MMVIETIISANILKLPHERYCETGRTRHCRLDNRLTIYLYGLFQPERIDSQTDNPQKSLSPQHNRLFMSIDFSSQIFPAPLRCIDRAAHTHRNSQLCFVIITSTPRTNCTVLPRPNRPEFQLRAIAVN